MYDHAGAPWIRISINELLDRKRVQGQDVDVRTISLLGLSRMFAKWCSLRTLRAERQADAGMMGWSGCVLSCPHGWQAAAHVLLTQFGTCESLSLVEIAPEVRAFVLAS